MTRCFEYCDLKSPNGYKWLSPSTGTTISRPVNELQEDDRSKALKCRRVPSR